MTMNEQSESVQAYRLCNICENLDLSATNNREARRKHKLGTIAEINGNTHCPFCILVSILYRADLHSPTENISFEWDPKQGFTGLSDSATNLVFLNEASATSPYGSARKIQPQIDPGLIRKWLRLCESHHEQTCVPQKGVVWTPKNPLGVKVLRVIDVQDQCIVEAFEGVRYVALSYVWGEVVPTTRLMDENKIQLMTKGGLLPLRQTLPKTINDAIDLVNMIGERYLWIDSLCLVQNNPIDMGDGISKMDLVYQGALLTIVAAHGVDANAGLPGVHPSSRNVPQLVVNVMPGIEMTVSMAVYTALDWSKHHTRGWTMQELVLSHRTLVFAAGRIWFLCRKNCWSEDTIFDNFPTEPNETVESGNQTDFIPDKSPKPIMTYDASLLRYGQRDLTKDSDTINAMMGILQHLIRQMKSGLLEGTPTAFFDIGILFFDPFPGDSKVGRRHEFPSWSWAGWHGMKKTHVNFSADPGQLNSWLRTMTYITWYKHNSTTDELELVWDSESQAKYGSLEELDVGYRSNSNDPYGRRDVDPTLNNTNLNTRPNRDNISREIVHRAYHTLHFWAHTIRFSKLKAPVTDIYGRPENTRTHGIYGATDILCSGMKLDDPLLVPGLEGPHEAIILSKVDEYNNFFNNGIEDDSPFYWVMLVDWQDPEKVVAERRGLGYIFLDCMEHMLSPGMEWKEFVLA